MSLCSVDPPTWSQRRAPSSDGVPSELLRALVMRDRHETLPRNLEEHHSQRLSELVTQKIRQKNSRAVYLSPTVQKVRRADAATSRFSGFRFSFLFQYRIVSFCTRRPPSSCCLPCSGGGARVFYVQRSAPLRDIARKKFTGRRSPSSSTWTRRVCWFSFT